MQQTVYQDGNSESLALINDTFGTTDVVCVFMKIYTDDGIGLLVVGFADDTYFH